jgi:hypothetical protein
VSNVLKKGAEVDFKSTFFVIVDACLSSDCMKDVPKSEGLAEWRGSSQGCCMCHGKQEINSEEPNRWKIAVDKGDGKWVIHSLCFKTCYLPNQRKKCLKIAFDKCEEAGMPIQERAFHVRRAASNV